jgi:hypothetical protein
MARKKRNEDSWRKPISGRVSPDTMTGIAKYAKEKNLITHAGKPNVGRIVDILWKSFIQPESG